MEGARAIVATYQVTPVLAQVAVVTVFFGLPVVPYPVLTHFMVPLTGQLR